MVAPSRYALLLRLASERTDRAAKQLGQSQQRLQAAEAKLMQLSQYLGEYRQQRLARASQGMGALQWNDFQRFLERLEDAERSQQRDCEWCRQAVEQARQQWQEARQHQRAMETLTEQEAMRLLAEQTRREQKQTDELATRAFMRKD
ncbi:flagellar export protein FliJ [Laribacter hongkongensis]|uniref:flagellar export protein FliJ n=1 Tax=Laribacter hongkongensis TaxID=168471 RepID=UPI001EFC81E0|nr:flagellar export protein FliJ [Laribacter hongkongensis]MCG9064382.1 flagellar export protein FliJ [Laribacter hongkongensis]MCG9114953.1 flagellar export protein FliJ [Laribacter hongkongensis]